jgi:uncharacterized protein YhbP (UPF0306 family)
MDNLETIAKNSYFNRKHHARFSPIRFVVTNLVGVRFINQVLGFSISMIVIRGDNPVFNLLMIHFSI